MTTQHTPGPWSFTTDCIAIWNGPNARKALQIADLSSEGSPDIDVAETLANARLIAAAPDLLAALKAFDDAFSHYCEGDPDSDEVSALYQAREAIAKATGETA